MPDIVKDYEDYTKNMICTDQQRQKCYYNIDDRYQFLYEDGIAEIIPIRNEMSTHAPKYYKRPPKNQDGFITENFPHLKQRKKFVVAIVIIILLILILIGIFFTYEVYYVYIVPFFQKHSTHRQ